MHPLIKLLSCVPVWHLFIATSTWNIFQFDKQLKVVKLNKSCAFMTIPSYCDGWFVFRLAWRCRTTSWRCGVRTPAGLFANHAPPIFPPQSPFTPPEKSLELPFAICVCAALVFYNNTSLVTWMELRIMHSTFAHFFFSQTDHRFQKNYWCIPLFLILFLFIIQVFCS